MAGLAARAKALRVSLHLNLASGALKLGEYYGALAAARVARELEPRAVKPLYREAQAHVALQARATALFCLPSPTPTPRTPRTPTSPHPPTTSHSCGATCVAESAGGAPQLVTREMCDLPTLRAARAIKVTLLQVEGSVTPTAAAVASARDAKAGAVP